LSLAGLEFCAVVSIGEAMVVSATVEVCTKVRLEMSFFVMVSRH